MNTPIFRLVCTNCLRSVEMTADGLTPPPHECPYCGGAFESTPDQFGPEFPSPLTPLSFELSPDEPTPLAETVEHATGAHVGRFQLRESLGGGGSGQVHR